MRKQLFLSVAAVALLVTGAAAQATRDEPPRSDSRSRAQQSAPQRPQIERIPDVNRQKDETVQAQSTGQAQNAAPPAQNNVTQQNAQQPAQTGQQQQNNAQRPAQTGQQQQNTAVPDRDKQQNNAAAPNQSTGTAQRGTTAPAQSGQATQQQPQPTGQQREQQPSGSRPAGQAQQQQQPTRNAAGSTQQRNSGVVSLNAQQQTRIGQTIARHNVKPVTNVNFSISVGTRVPRSVTLRALPADLVTFVPQYRGYSYFVVEEQIVIVEPSTHEIVTIVPYTGKTVRTETRTTTARSEKVPMASRSVSLSTEQRDAIRKHAVKKQTTRESSPSTRYKAGDVVERTVTIERFPETAYEEVPVVRRYRYFTDDDAVILVDPDEDRVVDVIR